MKGQRKYFAAVLIMIILFTGKVYGATDTYTVQPGDSLWTIAKKYKVGISEIIDANKQLKNPNLIYPGDKITVPLPDPAIASLEEQVVALCNQERAKQGLKPLSINWELSRVARYKSQDMANNNYFSHTSPTYGSPFDMLKKFNIKYSSAGENIAKGQKTAQAVVNAWMASEGHRKNILNGSFTQIGVGYVSTGSLWTQMFITP